MNKVVCTILSMACHTDATLEEVFKDRSNLAELPALNQTLFDRMLALAKRELITPSVCMDEEAAKFLLETT